MRIVDLRVGDRVRSAFGVLGSVIKFERDRVVIRWDNHDTEYRYTDAELRNTERVSALGR